MRNQLMRRCHEFVWADSCNGAVFFVDGSVGNVSVISQHVRDLPEVRPSRGERARETRQAGVLTVAVDDIEDQGGAQEGPRSGVELCQEGHDGDDHNGDAEP